MAGSSTFSGSSLIRIASVYPSPLLALNFSLSSTFTLFLVSLSLITFFLGAARYQYSIPTIDAHHIAWYNDRQYGLLVTGVLTEPPDTRDTYTNLRLRVQSVDTGDESLPVGGLILARILRPDLPLRRGDPLRR